MVYRLELPHLIKQLHPVFNVVKLSAVPKDLIPDHRPEEHSLPVIIDREKKWEIEDILDSHQHRGRFQYLIKWKGYGQEHNS